MTNSSKLFKLISIALFFVHSIHGVKADEGMWLPQLLQQLNAPEMRLKGLQVPVEEIYNLNHRSMKDAVVLFGQGCTGEIISDQGLMLTNHHCGFSQIQDHSSLEHNYLRDGFWAPTMNDELPCNGLTATIIVRIDDVSNEFDKLLRDDMSEQKRNDIIREIASQVEKKAVEGTIYEAKVKQFYSGNKFYLIVSQTFRDVRMVGAPPSSIGKFGGDTDNWMWPRHNADFSLFRIYANKENKPADYSKDNVPFKPDFFFSISLAGVQENDFTMVYGFPGRTQEYLSSFAVDHLLNYTDPNRVYVRNERLRIMDEAMRSSETLHIQYAAKQGSVSNGWKKWKGEMIGLTKANALQKKRDFEDGFTTWANADPSRKEKYGQLLPSFQKLYASYRPYLSANDFYSEAVFGVEMINFSNGLKAFVDQSDTAKSGKGFRDTAKGLQGYFKNYDAATDRKMMASLLQIFDISVPDSLKPFEFTDMRHRYKGDFNALAEIVFKKSALDDAGKLQQLLEGSPVKVSKKIRKDFGYQFSEILTDFYNKQIATKSTEAVNELARLNRLYMAGQMEMQPDRKFYPDANSTLRLAYGQVHGYDARDAMRFDFQTTLDGVMEKYIAGDEEFDVPQRLIDLYKAKDYGRYADKGKMPVAFIATNHTTGGNSGSPVLNAKGQLIGTNFDRVWEGTMSDVMFNPEVCRNVVLDIRYTLFIIDKYAGATRLINEMDLIP